MFTRFRIRAVNQGKDIWPILWDDNYFSLLPYENTTVTATYDTPSVWSQSSEPQIIVELWNNISSVHTD